MATDCVFVTGGAGFIGGNFARVALERGWRVVNLDALTYAGGEAAIAALDEFPGHLFIHGAIEDRQCVDALLRRHRPRAVINFAAESHVDRSIADPGAFVRSNVVGTFELLEAATAYWRGLDGDAKSEFRYLQISTDEVFGSIEHGAVSETGRFAPNSPYAASKAAADHFVRAYHRTYGLPAMVTAATNNFGPWQFPEKLIPLVIVKALNEEPVPIYGDGENQRDWLYVADHCTALMRVIEAGVPGETYNIAGNNGRSNLEVVRAVLDVLDNRRPRPGGASHLDLIEFVSDRPGHDRRYALDAGKIERELGWRPQKSFVQAIGETVDWYLDNEAWWRAILASGYDGHRLGLLAAGGKRVGVGG